MFTPKSLILLISKAQRQAGELFRYVRQGYNAVERFLPTVKETETQLEFANESRIVCLPGKEGTIRSYQGVSLLLIDEASGVPDDLIASVTPMLAISKGDLAASTLPISSAASHPAPRPRSPTAYQAAGAKGRPVSAVQRCRAKRPLAERPNSPTRPQPPHPAFPAIDEKFQLISPQRPQAEERQASRFGRG